MKNLKFLIILVLLCVSCSNQSKQDVTEALEALKLVESGASLGVGHGQFVQSLTQAQVKVKKAVSVLPDGELKDSLQKALDAYLAANDIWIVLIDSVPRTTADLDASEAGMKRIQENFKKASELIEKTQRLNQ